jgi:hypothetical protein
VRVAPSTLSVLSPLPVRHRCRGRTYGATPPIHETVTISDASGALSLIPAALTLGEVDVAFLGPARRLAPEASASLAKSLAFGSVLRSPSVFSGQLQGPCLFHQTFSA